MIVPSCSNTVEIEVKKSRFIATAFYCDSFDELKKIISQTRSENPGANHVVHAAIIGTQFSVSDDHEPKNTAGRPALEVLKGSGISNIGLTITRYFGGTLLGTGGLVKAYGDSAKAALATLQTEEFILRKQVCFNIGYEYQKSVTRILESCKATEINIEYSDALCIKALLPLEQITNLQNQVKELTLGKLIINI